MDNVKQLIHFMKANFNTILIRSTEEERALRTIFTAVQQNDGKNKAEKIYLWTCTNGIKETWFVGGRPKTKDLNSCQAMGDAVTFFMKEVNTNAIMVLQDTHRFLSQHSMAHVNIRKIRDFALAPKSNKLKTIILLVPHLDIPMDLQNEIQILDFDLPDRNDVEKIIRSSLKSLANEPTVMQDYTNEKMEHTVNALVGLTQNNIKDICYLSLVRYRNIDSEFCKKEKARILKERTPLTFMESNEKIEHIGGLEVLKHWINVRKNIFSKEAQAFGLKPCKKILLTGIPGTGKSLTAKVIPALTNSPHIRLDIGDLMSKYLGESQANLNNALKVIETSAPGCVELSEIEKGFTLNEQDHSAKKNMMGKLLDWLEETTANLMIIATANDITALPPELVSRFEVIFFLDFPNKDERKEIFEIHIKRKGRDPKNYDIGAFVKGSENFVGRDIAHAIDDALDLAFFQNREQDLTTQNILDAMKSINPMHEHSSKKIQTLREKAQAIGAKNASNTDNKEVQDFPSLNEDLFEDKRTIN
jgi:ATP-dependent 26S proteasome regulatory subunit